MASTSTTEATEVRRRGRQRLIGAIALVAVLVVFVPMILDSEPRTKGDQPTLAIPPKDNAPPLPAPPKAAPAPAQAAKPAETPKAVEVAKTDAKVAEAKVLEPSRPPAPKPAPPAAAAPAPAAAPRLEGFAVQVGAFRDEAKLDQARQKLN